MVEGVEVGLGEVAMVKAEGCVVDVYDIRLSLASLKSK